METVFKPFLKLLREVYIGSETAEVWIIERKPGHGFTAAIKDLTAKEASTPLVAGGSTIAAHTEHLRWSLKFAMGFYKGAEASGNWEESWTVTEVNQEEWEQLQLALLVAYQELIYALKDVVDWSNELLLTGTLALLPHAAYHLGAVKQLITAVKGHRIV